MAVVLEVALGLLDEPRASGRPRVGVDGPYRGGALAEAGEHRVDVELVGHGSTLPRRPTRATSTRSRPARSGRTDTSANPARRASRGNVGLVRCELRHEDPALASSPLGCPCTMTSIASKPVGPLTSAPRGSQSATTAGNDATSCSAT